MNDENAFSLQQLQQKKSSETSSSSESVKRILDPWIYFIFPTEYMSFWVLPFTCKSLTTLEMWSTAIGSSLQTCEKSRPRKLVGTDEREVQGERA